MASSAKVFLLTCLLLHISMQHMCSGSAIPIWEFLTHNEKMSYLYSTFAQLVSVHCKATAATTTTPVNQCKRDLLSYGYEKLQTFRDEDLDAFDPYQREANELIWSSIMREHPSATLVTTRKPLATPPATSLIILTAQKPVAHAGTPSAGSAEDSAESQTATATATAGHHYPKNPLFDNDAEHKHQYAMDMDIAYGYAPRPHDHMQGQVETFVPQPAQKQPTPNGHKTYLTGPLVFRVRPDGTPVEEDLYKPLPRDDDLETFQGTHKNRNSNSNNNNKHRKIATISALKPEHVSHIALQQQQQDYPTAARFQRQQRVDTYPAAGHYYFPRAQA